MQSLKDSTLRKRSILSASSARKLKRDSSFIVWLKYSQEVLGRGRFEKEVQIQELENKF